MANSTQAYPRTSREIYFADQLAIWINLGFDLPAATNMAEWHTIAALGQDKSSVAEYQKDHDEDEHGDYR